MLELINIKAIAMDPMPYWVERLATIKLAVEYGLFSEF